jgi:hypothetical protein
VALTGWIFEVKKRMKNKNNFLKTGRFVEHAKGQSIMCGNEEWSGVWNTEFRIQNSKLLLIDRKIFAGIILLSHSPNTANHH